MKNQDYREELPKIIALWQEVGVNGISFTFNCGGDSMEDFDIDVDFNKDKATECYCNRMGYEYSPDAEITPERLDDFLKDIENDFDAFFNELIMDEIEFYEVSDGNYMGEHGVVEVVALGSETTDYDPTLHDAIVGFRFTKNTTSDWEESLTEEARVELTQEEADFFRNHVRDMNAFDDPSDADSVNVNYSNDFIMTEAYAALEESIKEKLITCFFEHDFNVPDGSYLMDWGGYFETDSLQDTEDGESVLIVAVTCRVEEQREDEDEQTVTITL